MTVALPDADNALVGLPERYARTERRKKWRAFSLVLPLLAFIAFFFLIPAVYMLWKSVENSIVPEILSRTVVALEQWDGKAPPDDDAYAAILADIRDGAEAKSITRVGQRLNYEVSGVSSLFRKSARHVKRLDDAIFQDAAMAREALVKIDKKWGDIVIWRTIKQFSPPLTGSYYAASFDFHYNAKTGEHELYSEERRIYIKLFIRTLVLSLLITFCTFLLGYPTAFLLATLPSRTANLLMILVLLPFWTSLLVRTTSWIVLLQQQGVLNDLLVVSGVIDEDERLHMIHNAIGTVVAMTHILLPFMILPMYSVMKSINPSHMRAARSLGADAFTAFRRVYFPQTLPGIGAGGVLVFILAIGYYITPALVGGTTGTFISNRIAYHVSSSLNWGLAAALGFLLLMVVLALYWIYDRVVGTDKMKLG